MTVVQTNMGFLEKLTQTIYLDRVLKILGVAVFVLVFLNSWGSLSLLHKVGFGVAPAMWFVGARFTKIYR
jgi:hypothetical protein